MNLGKLLGAGKSFFGGHDSISYREKKGVYLPKFNAAKNPFAPKPAEASAAPAVEPVVPAAQTAAKPEQKFASVETKPARSVNWAKKLNPFRASEVSAPPVEKVVQTELSLDAVKVVHNDLADADIEIVPVKSRTAAAPETPMLSPAREPWEYLGERLVKQS